MNNTRVASLLLRTGLATVFLYASISSFMHPNDWIGYLPNFARNALDPKILLKGFSAYELILALWLLSGKYTKYAAGLAAMTLAGIVIFNLSLFAITFRDVALIFSALALMLLSKSK